MELLKGQTGIVFGVANKRSIAWGIAQALAAAGMRLAFTYQGDRLRENVEELVATMPGSPLYPCDVGSDADVQSVFTALERDFGTLDTLVHSVAFAPPDDLKGDFIATSRDGFRVAHDGSIIAMTYYGSEKVAAGYKVMGVAKAALEASVRYAAAELGPKGIRVNAISAGPVNTLAARGVRGFTDMLKYHAERAPLRRNIELREIGDTAVFLASSMSSAITGEVIFVDAGYNIMAV
jgi:enoyl-[acyl-carrier protein] reductase I